MNCFAEPRLASDRKYSIGNRWRHFKITSDGDSGEQSSTIKTFEIFIGLLRDASKAGIQILRVLVKGDDDVYQLSLQLTSRKISRQNQDTTLFLFSKRTVISHMIHVPGSFLVFI